MVVTYRNNRLVPAVIIAICITLVFFLVDPSVENYGNPVPKMTDDDETRVEISPPTESHVSEVIAEESVEHVETPRPTVPSPSPVTSINLDEDDILLIMKTGGTSMWKRLLIHLTTTLSNERISPSNIVIYSDLPETIGTFKIVDIFANMTTKVKQSPDFEHYIQQPEYQANNAYVEAAGINGDDWGPAGGWVIDKYKFIPLIQHAGENWPHAKWYVYMEDDTYLFLPNVRKYLASFDHRGKHYLGSYAAKSDVVFAHGGAGFAISRGAWEESFGKKPNMSEDYHQYTADHCCGDQVLAKALTDNGVSFGENGGDEKFTWGFNPLVHWTFPFSKHNWCSPLLSWHKVHNRDVAQYYEFEKSWDFTKHMLHRDFYTNMILPRIQKTVEWWDNMASLYEISSANKAWAPGPEDESTYDSAVWKKGWESVNACEAACKSWDSCVMWSYVEDLCKMDDKMVLGQGFAPAMSQRKTSLMHTSGWFPNRLDNWSC